MRRRTPRDSCCRFEKAMPAIDELPVEQPSPSHRRAVVVVNSGAVVSGCVGQMLEPGTARPASKQGQP
jgi:hypothetical protein